MLCIHSPKPIETLNNVEFYGSQKLETDSGNETFVLKLNKDESNTQTNYWTTNEDEEQKKNIGKNNQMGNNNDVKMMIIFDSMGLTYYFVFFILHPHHT